MARRRIKQPITLRISEAEVLESQLSPDDLSALEPLKGADEEGLEAGSRGTVLCPRRYCSRNYVGPAIAEEAEVQ
jgi:hypothetical protein